MTPKSKELLMAKVDQLKKKKYTALYLGDETKKEISINSPEDMKNYYNNAKIDIDNMLNSNKGKEYLAIAFIVGIFIIGLAIILYSTIYGKGSTTTPAGTIAGMGISIIWPISRLLQIRDDNIHLQKYLLLVPLLPFEDAGEKAEKILFGGKNDK
jgi:hypothetical protein